MKCDCFFLIYATPVYHPYHYDTYSQMNASVQLKPEHKCIWIGRRPIKRKTIQEF